MTGCNAVENNEGALVRDVLIIGGGLSGALAAAVLGRAGLDVVVVDRHAVYPPDFRAEQLVGKQTKILARLGLLEGIVGGNRPESNAAAACYGKILNRTHSPHYGLRYDEIVNAARSLAVQASFVTGRVARVVAGPDTQSVHLADDDVLTARLVVVATGPNCDDLLATMGIERRMLSGNHSITCGFDVATGFRGIVAYQGERAGDGMDYLVFFPMGNAMRANLFCYRDLGDPWVKRLREEPRHALLDVMPGLERAIGPFAVSGKVQVRPNSIQRADGAEQKPGIVLVGDAYQTPCPSVGMGVVRALADVEALSRLVPSWLSTPGMGAEKIREFYRDPEKSAIDAEALRTATYRRALCTETGWSWRARRVRIYCTHWGRALLQAVRRDQPEAGGALAETAA